MKNRKWWGLFLVLCMLPMVVLGCGSQKRTTLKLGTGGTGGNYYSYGNELMAAVKEETQYRLDVRATAGSRANVRLLSQGYLDLALVQSDILEESIQSGMEGFHAVAGLYDEVCQIVVAADSDIMSVQDLQGRRVSLGEKDSGSYQNALEILGAYGVNVDRMNVSYLSYAESAQALKEDRIDAFFLTASVPTTSLVVLGEEFAYRLLEITPVIAEAMVQDKSAYKVCTIPAETYPGQNTDLNTIGVTAVLVANDSLKEEAEQAIVELLKERNASLQSLSFGVPVEVKTKGIFTVSLNMYLTMTLAVGVLYLGVFLRKKIRFLETFCIPAPVIGGMIFAIVSCILHATGVIEFTFDETLKNICMIIFFTSVGFQANLKILKKGGVSLVIFLLCVLTLIFVQNGLAVGLSRVLKIDPFIGLCTGSIPMVGGHGTSGAFGQVLEDLGLAGATTLCTAAATFGLVAGSLMGGPIGRRLIVKKDLLKTAVNEDTTALKEDEVRHHRKASMYAPAAYQIAIAMGIGTIVSELLSKTGMTFPVYIGAMIVAAIIRNVGEYSGKYTVHMGEINDIGGICLSLFLGIAMVTLKLWQLADLALPLVVLLTAQTIFMMLFSYFVVFNVMGRNYDAAVLSAGTCGFGMGATPNAMANMQAITEKFVPSVQAYILVPIVGSMFADFLNSLIITFFINIL